MTTISVVTPWRDHPELADDYFDALSVLRSDDELLVVDNGSVPPLGFADIRNDSNLGFAKASNQGLLAATGDAVLFLNNDVMARRYDWLERLRAAVEPGVLVGASLRYDAHGSVDGQQLPYLDGWCLAGVRDDLVALGGFDEDFDEPAYYSDNDLCLRARANGIRLREVRVGLRHKIGMTAGSHEQPVVQHAVRANHARFADRARQLLTA